MSQHLSNTSEQYGEDDVYDEIPSSYRPSLSTGVYGSYVLLEPPTCTVCQHQIGSQQSVSLDCCSAHFHTPCFNDILKYKQIKPGKTITLNKLGCIHCRDQMECTSVDYYELLSTVNLAYDRLVQCARNQLEKDGRFGDEELIEEKSEYYNKPERYAMELYQFRSCYHCRQPFCAGNKCVCSDDMKEENIVNLQQYCCSRECAYQIGKLTYKQRGEPLIRDTSDVLSDIRQNAKSYKNVALPLNLGRDKPFSEWNEREFKREFSAKFNIPIECIQILSVTAGSQIIDLKLNTYSDGAKLLLPIESIAENISTDKAKKELAEFGIFAMEFGKVDTNPDFTLKRQRVIMNPRWNKLYGPEYGVYWKGRNTDGKSRGNEPYYCPVGWKRFAIQFKATPYDFANVYDNWPIAYHGTKFDYSMMITLSGLKTSNNGCGWGTGVYLSPSIKYVSHPIYAKPKKLNLAETSIKRKWSAEHIEEFRKYDGKWIQVAFACRVKPGCYEKRGQTMGNFGLHGQSGYFDGIPKSKLEWVVRGDKGEVGELIGQDKILIYGIMIRACDKMPTKDAQHYRNYDSNHIYYKPPQNDGGCVVM